MPKKEMGFGMGNISIGIAKSQKDIFTSGYEWTDIGETAGGGTLTFESELTDVVSDQNGLEYSIPDYVNVTGNFTMLKLDPENYAKVFGGFYDGEKVVIPASASTKTFAIKITSKNNSATKTQIAILPVVQTTPGGDLSFTPKEGMKLALKFKALAPKAWAVTTFVCTNETVTDEAILKEIGTDETSILLTKISKDSIVTTDKVVAGCEITAGGYTGQVVYAKATEDGTGEFVYVDPAFLDVAGITEGNVKGGKTIILSK